MKAFIKNLQDKKFVCKNRKLIRELSDEASKFGAVGFTFEDFLSANKSVFQKNIIPVSVTDALMGEHLSQFRLYSYQDGFGGRSTPLTEKHYPNPDEFRVYKEEFSKGRKAYLNKRVSDY